MNPTVVNILKSTQGLLEKSQVAGHLAETESLLSKALGLNRSGLYLHFDKRLSKGQIDYFLNMVERRIKGEPLAYILGEQPFRNINLEVSQDVLIPRNETELLVDRALKMIKGAKSNPIKALDLGTGSGALALSLAKEIPNSEVWATDISALAIEIAKKNGRKNGLDGRVSFIESDLFSALGPDHFGSFDLMLSNPPYIKHGDLAGLPKEVKDFEPILALDGGDDGLDFYRRIIPHSSNYLKGGGYLILEIGWGQAKEVQSLIMATDDFNWVDVSKDYAGLDRVVVARNSQRID
ncbi:MAG: peptide chain release factor N(5)-glutamine methyltransferase [Actinomycetota bacterium]|nr:peptide chain release factor N(5)-glutamine methyltransferase [Actinomycetota bacterium]